MNLSALRYQYFHLDVYVSRYALIVLTSLTSIKP